MAQIENRRKIDIAGIVQRRKQAFLKRVRQAAKSGEKLYKADGMGRLEEFVNQVLDTIRACATELIDSIPDEALWNQQWSEALDLVADFINEQGDWLFKRCLELWGEEALAVQEHIADSCARMASAMGERIEIGHRLERRSFWDIAVRDTVNTPPAEMVKLLLISVLALIFGFLMGRWL